MKKALATALLAIAVTGTVSSTATATDFNINDYFAEQQRNGR